MGEKGQEFGTVTKRKRRCGWFDSVLLKKSINVNGITDIVLTKLDVDAKGGAALSISSAIDKPIAFVGIGQEYEDIMPFDAAWIVERIFA